MTTDELKKKLEANPRFVRAKETGVAYIFVGYKPPEAVKAHRPKPGDPRKPVRKAKS